MVENRNCEVNPCKQVRIVGPTEIRFLTVQSSLIVIPNGAICQFRWGDQTGTVKRNTSVTIQSTIGTATFGVLDDVRGYGVHLNTEHKFSTISL